MNDALRRKLRGAFFTPPEVTSFLVNWAIQSKTDSVLEPSCGEAAFLEAAARRIQKIGGDSLPAIGQIQGVEIDPQSATTARSKLSEMGVAASVVEGDFFDYQPETLFSAVVGNPPFVRYQQHSGAARVRSLEAALAHGVRLSGLASSWAAFVVHSAELLVPAGRLALVLPAELLSVGYASEVRKFLLKRFSSIKLVTFEERIFPGVLEDVVLLLAEGRGEATHFELFQAKNALSLGELNIGIWPKYEAAGAEKWTPALIPAGVFKNYTRFCREKYETLADWGSTYLGSVTGNNRYFAISVEEANKIGLSRDDLLPISPPGSRHLKGLKFTHSAWKSLEREGARCFLFYPAENTSEAALGYIQQGERAGVSNGYKCKVRNLWWKVPRVDCPDLFFTYMNHERPRIIANEAKANILNSLYGVRLHADRRSVGRELLPVAALNSVTLLGAEIVGRTYGGGLLKMEPREAARLPVPSLELLKSKRSALLALVPQLAKSLRNNELELATKKVDEVLFEELSEEIVAAFRDTRTRLFERRVSRGKHGPS